MKCLKIQTKDIINYFRSDEMNKRTKEFLERFKDFDNNDIKVIFGDLFSEFIEEINNIDLSENTLIHLNGIFEKDMIQFFEKIK